MQSVLGVTLLGWESQLIVDMSIELVTQIRKPPELPVLTMDLLDGIMVGKTK